MDRTIPFQGIDTGSIPVRDGMKRKIQLKKNRYNIVLKNKSSIVLKTIYKVQKNSIKQINQE